MAGKAELCPSLHADNARAENNDVFANETMFSVPVCTCETAFDDE